MGWRTRIIYHHLYTRRGFTALRPTWNRYQLFLSKLPNSQLQRYHVWLTGLPNLANDAAGA